MGNVTYKNQPAIDKTKGSVLLYSRSFSSFFVRFDKILLFNYQAVTIIIKNNC
jgi:hypothetical protein